MRRARLPLRVGVEGISRTRNAGRRTVTGRIARVGSPRTADIQPRNQGGRRTRREHHDWPDAVSHWRRAGPRPRTLIERDLRRRPKNRRHARDHHSRYEIRVWSRAEHWERWGREGYISG